MVDTLRAVRFSSRTPSRASSWRMVWLKAEGDRPRCSAARTKLDRSATAATAFSSANQVQPFEVVQEEGAWCVRSHITGNFPGSPVDLRYRFRLDDGRVAALEITA